MTVSPRLTEIYFYILQRAISSREPASHFVRLHNSIRGIVTFFHGDDKHKIEADERLMRVARYDDETHVMYYYGENKYKFSPRSRQISKIWWL